MRPPASPLAQALFALALLPTLAPPARGQADRHELGRRVVAFERLWDERPSEAARAEASRSLIQAVNRFFAGRQDEAARQIAEARFALEGAPIAPAQRWAEALSVRPSGRLLDASAGSLEVTVAPFYRPEGDRPDGLTLRLTLGRTVEVPLGDLPFAAKIPLEGLKAGDLRLAAEVRRGEAVLARSEQAISLVERRDERLNALKARIPARPREGDAETTDRATARMRLAMLGALAEGKALEMDVPAARLLGELEEQARALDAGRPFLGRDRAGDQWVTLTTPSGLAIPARVFVPEAAAKGAPLPLVVAMHGAGGSENLFFESYGHGKIVDLCRDRGWMLVSPRSGPLGGSRVADVVDALAKLYPIDPGRVALVGHSMGAAGAVAAAQIAPRRYRAVAALGGGGAVRAVDGLRDVAFFVGVGSKDFALRGSRSLVDGLKRAGVATVESREYPSIEHLAIVQVALPDVFRFFDDRLGIARKRE